MRGGIIIQPDDSSVGVAALEVLVTLSWAPSVVMKASHRIPGPKRRRPCLTKRVCLLMPGIENPLYVLST